MKNFPKLVYVNSGDVDMLAMESIDEAEDGDTVGVYELKEVKQVRVSREIVTIPTSRGKKK